MGSSAKTENKIFRGSLEHFLDKNAIWDRTPPAPTHQLQSTCVGEGSRVPNLQTEFNYLDLFKSYGIFSDFVVPMWSLSSPSSPRRPRVIPIIPTLFPHRSHRPQKVPMWSPWSVVSTCCPCHPHIVPVILVSSLSSPHRLEGPHIMPNPPDTHFTHPQLPWGGGGPKSVKMQ